MDKTAQLQPPAPGDDLEKIPVEQVLRKLTVKSDTGLSTAEAAQRLFRYGPNALVEKEVSRPAVPLPHYSRAKDHGRPLVGAANGR
jgi:Cation transporter/ATPase, N-terminus